MRALVYTGERTMEMRDVAPPAAGGDEVLVDVAACGICGSDMHAYLGHDPRRPAPLVLGHEIAGRVASGPRTGERVTLNPLVACGRCRYCQAGRDNLCPDRQILSMPPRQGGFAERVAIPVDNCVPIPDGIEPTVASLVEPLACGWHAVRLVAEKLTSPLDQTACMVFGGGAIGAGAARALQAQGAKSVRVIEPHDERRVRLRERMGFTVHAAPDDVSDGDPVDLVIDAVGIEATRAAAFERVAPGGVIAHIGLGSAAGGVDARRATLQEITFFGTYTYTSRDFVETAEALFSGLLDVAGLFDVHELDEGADVFEALLRQSLAAPKVVLTI